MSKTPAVMSARTVAASNRIVQILSTASLLLVVGQTVTAGLTVLLDHGWLSLHAMGGKVGSALIAAVALTTWLAPQPRGVRRAASLLALFYVLQAVWLYVAKIPTLGWAKALHVPNSLFVFLFSWQLWLASNRAVRIARTNRRL